MRVRDSTILMSVTGFYTATLIVANVTAGKLFNFFGASISAGAFAYIVCLGASDVLVDVYGPGIGYRLVRLATFVNIVALLFEQVALHLPTAHGLGEFNLHFSAVFDASTSVLLASIIGFPITDSFETFVWKRMKILTKGRHLLLRNTCVKLPGQLLDATIFYNLAFFILPFFLYRQRGTEMDQWWSVMKGAWIYGLWKGVLGALDYPLIRLIIPWIRSHRIADIPELAERAAEEGYGARE